MTADDAAATTGHMPIPVWLTEHERPPNRPTELFLTVEIGVGPVWDYADSRGGWYARLDVPPSFDPWWECGDIHATQDEAWACAEVAARSLIPRPHSGRSDV